MAASSLPKGRIQTVTGPVRPEELGVTLAHEHVYITLWEIPHRYDGAGITENDEVLTAEILAYKELGGQAIVDQTVPDIGRSPEKLRALAERTGIKIVMGCGWYREPYFSPGDQIDRRSVDDLADQLIRELTEGVGPDRIRPGFIGELGADKSWLSAQEERVLRAGARAQRATGVALTTHAARSPVGLAQLKVLDEEGVDLSRVLVGHCDSYPFLDYYLQILERGACIEFDNIRTRPRGPADRLVRLLLELLDRGYAGRVLLSHDVCYNQQLSYHGGDGYTYILSTFLPRLRAEGVPEELIRRMTVDNPARVFTVAG